MRITNWLVGCALVWGVTACDVDESDVDAPVVVDPDPFCANRPSIFFCEDFDSNSLPNAFDSYAEEGSGKLTLESEGKPYKAYVLQAATLGEGRAQVTKSFEQEGFKFRIFGFIWLAEPTGEAGETEVCGIDVTHEDGRVQRLGLKVRADGTSYAYSAIGGQVDTFESSHPIEFGAWGTFRFDYFSLDANHAEFHVRFGSESVVWEKTVSHIGEYGYGTMHIGLVSEGNAAWTVRYDDLTFEID